MATLPFATQRSLVVSGTTKQPSRSRLRAVRLNAMQVDSTGLTGSPGNRSQMQQASRRGTLLLLLAGGPLLVAGQGWQAARAAEEIAGGADGGGDGGNSKLRRNSEVNAADSAYIQELVERSKANKDKYDRERLNSYYKRNFKDYFEFVDGNLGGYSKETQASIKKWLEENK